MESSSAAVSKPRTKKPFKVPIVLAPIYVPLFFLGAAVSIPWTYIQKSVQRRRERQFTEQMKKAHRLMDWQAFQQAQQNGTGTAIGEYLSTKGPFRLWWTAEDIQALSPHEWKREQHFAWIEDEFRPFFEWCYARYTNPQSGTAQTRCCSTTRAKTTEATFERPTLCLDLFVSIGAGEIHRKHRSQLTGLPEMWVPVPKFGLRLIGSETNHLNTSDFRCDRDRHRFAINV